MLLFKEDAEEFRGERPSRSISSLNASEAEEDEAGVAEIWGTGVKAMSLVLAAQLFSEPKMISKVKVKDFLKEKLGLASVTHWLSIVLAPKCRQFDSWLGCVREATDQFLSPSLPLSLKIKNICNNQFKDCL